MKYCVRLRIKIYAHERGTKQFSPVSFSTGHSCTVAAMSEQHITGALSVSVFCRSYGIGRTTAYREIKAGRLRVFKVGDRTLVSTEAAETWRRDRERETAAGRAA
jgi:ribosomal protein S11